MHVLQKNAIREFFIGMAIGYRVYGAFGHGLRQVASVCLAIGDAADPPRPDRCRAGVARNPSMTAGRRGGKAAGIADGLSGLWPGLFQQSGKVGDVAEIAMLCSACGPIVAGLGWRGTRR